MVDKRTVLSLGLAGLLIGNTGCRHEEIKPMLSEIFGGGYTCPEEIEKKPGVFIDYYSPIVLKWVWDNSKFIELAGDFSRADVRITNKYEIEKKFRLKFIRQEEELFGKSIEKKTQENQLPLLKPGEVYETSFKGFGGKWLWQKRLYHYGVKLYDNDEEIASVSNTFTNLSGPKIEPDEKNRKFLEPPL